MYKSTVHLVPLAWMFAKDIEETLTLSPTANNSRVSSAAAELAPVILKCLATY